MSTIGQGGTITLDATFTDGAGNLVDPTTPLVDVLNPSDVALVTDGVPTRDSLGVYHYDYAVDAGAPLGAWTAHWTGTINGAAVSDDDAFTVVAAGEIAFDGTYRDKVRLMVGDTDSTDPLLYDDEVETIVAGRTWVDDDDATVVNIPAAAADAAGAIAAKFSRQFNFATDGQRFDLAQRASHYMVLEEQLRRRAGGVAEPHTSS